MYAPRWLWRQVETGENPDTMIARARPSFANRSDLLWSVKDIELMTASEGLDPTAGSLSLDVANDGIHHKATRRTRVICSIVVELELVEANIEEVLKSSYDPYCGPDLRSLYTAAHDTNRLACICRK
ncbi:hypothetical protein PMIN06_008428 [Paraphaeosphaeria minitans]